MWANPLLLWTFAVGALHLFLTCAAIVYIPRHQLDAAILDANAMFAAKAGNLDRDVAALQKSEGKLTNDIAIAKKTSEVTAGALHAHLDAVAAQAIAKKRRDR